MLLKNFLKNSNFYCLGKKLSVFLISCQINNDNEVSEESEVSEVSEESKMLENYLIHDPDKNLDTLFGFKGTGPNVFSVSTLIYQTCS